MKTNTNKNNGFTLIEMVGVLAVIAILAALLVPKIFAAINESRFNNTVASINSVKTASMSYFGKYGKFGGVYGGPFTNNAGTWDSVLVTENFLERPFQTKIADTWAISVETIDNTATSTNVFNLDGVTPLSGGNVVVAHLFGVDATDAVELSKRIDGDNLTSADALTADSKGRVEYTLPVAGKVADVRIYLAHK
jgi:prepilin-type N-terminal cleavage/methylation domain-containing protein